MLVAAVLVPSRAADAEPDEDRATAVVRLYADDDHVTVWSPQVAGRTSAGPVVVDVDVGADAISAASIDVVTSASPAPVSELRLEAGLVTRVALGAKLGVRLGGRVSHERDHEAARVVAGGRVELGRRNTVLDVTVRAGTDQARDASDPSFVEGRTGVAVLVAATQLVDRRTVIDAVLELERADGWFGSPYRRVAVAAPLGPLPELVREATPASRRLIAVSLRARRAVGARSFAVATVRGYRDGWEVTSLTVSGELITERTGGALWGLGVRGYGQDAASFWARRYDQGPAPTYRTADRALGPMSSLFLGATVDHPLDAGGAHLLGALGVTGYWFDSPAQRHRRALTGTVSLRWPL